MSLWLWADDCDCVCITKCFRIVYKLVLLAINSSTGSFSVVFVSQINIYDLLWLSSSISISHSLLDAPCGQMKPDIPSLRPTHSTRLSFAEWIKQYTHPTHPRASEHTCGQCRWRPPVCVLCIEKIKQNLIISLYDSNHILIQIN